MQYCTNPENSVKYTLAGGASGRSSVLDNPEVQANNPWNPVVYENLLYAHRWPKIPESSAIEDVFTEELTLALVGQKTAKQALDRAKERMEDVMSKAGYY